MHSKLLSKHHAPEWRAGWTPVEYFYEGQTVWTIWPSTGRDAVRCRVSVAAGDSAHVLNAERGVNTWVYLWEVRQGPPPGPAVPPET
jgi:hypothetical protein